MRCPLAQISFFFLASPPLPFLLLLPPSSSSSPPHLLAPERSAAVLLHLLLASSAAIGGLGSRLVPHSPPPASSSSSFFSATTASDASMGDDGATGSQRGAWKGSNVTEMEILMIRHARKFPRNLDFRVPGDELVPTPEPGESHLPHALRPRLRTPCE